MDTKLWAIFSRGALLGVALTLPVQGQKPVPNPTPEIAVSLSVTKRRITLGEQLGLRVEISNIGSSPFFVRSRILLIDDGITSLELALRDARGRLSPAVHVAESMHPPATPQEDAFKALLGEWTVLAPGYSVTHTIPVDDTYFEFLRGPGRYQLSGTYSSVGLDSPAAYLRLGLSRSKIEALPCPSWSGKVQTNSVWIEIVPRQKTRKRSEGRP